MNQLCPLVLADYDQYVTCTRICLTIIPPKHTPIYPPVITNAIAIATTGTAAKSPSPSSPMLRHAVFGSANINDRSMLGHRNSEMAFYLKDTEINDVGAQCECLSAPFAFCVVVHIVLLHSFVPFFVRLFHWDIFFEWIMRFNRRWVRVDSHQGRKLFTSCAPRAPVTHTIDCISHGCVRNSTFFFFHTVFAAVRRRSF